MGNITLFTNPAGEYYYFRKEIVEHVLNNREDGYLYLLPVNRAVRYFKKELLDTSGKSALRDPAVYTFNSFVRLLYSKTLNSKRIIPETLRLLYIDRFLNANQDQLNYLKQTQTSFAGLVHKTAGMLSEMCQFGMRPGHFKLPPASAEPKFHDLTQILTALVEIYGTDFIDETMIASEAANLLDIDLVQRLYPNLQCIYINGYGIYTPPMLEVLKKLSAKYDVAVHLEYNESNDALFSHTHTAFEALRAISARVVTTHGPEDFLSRTLFNADATISPTDNKPSCTIQPTMDREQEVHFMAGKIRELHVINNVALHKIAITFPDLEKYAPLIRKVFREYEIPYNLSTGFRLAQSPLIQAFLNVVHICDSNFSTQEMHKLISSPFLKPELRINLSFYRQWITQQRITHFYGNWVDTIKPVPDLDTDAAQETIDKISNIRDIIRPLGKTAKPDEFPVRLLETLDQLGMLSWHERETVSLQRDLQEREFRAYNYFYKILNHLALLESKRKIGLTEFYRKLQLIIYNATYNTKEWSNYGVQCMPRLEVQSLESDILFIGGFVEGDFPRSKRPDIFFNDDERAQMGLYANEDLLEQDRFLFYQLLKNSKRKTYILYPMLEGDSPVLPSSFIEDLKRVHGVTQLDTSVAKHILINRHNAPLFLTTLVRNSNFDIRGTLLQDCTNLLKNQQKTHLKDIIDELYIKYRRSGFSKYEGNLTTSTFVRSYLARELHNKNFSITALELYALCPIKYFLQRILNVPEEKETEELFSPMERGALIHGILFRFFSELKKYNLQQEPWLHTELLSSISREMLAQFNYDGIDWMLEIERLLGGPELTGVWDVFLTLEKHEISENGFVPQHFEFSFGLKKDARKSDTHSTEIPLIIQHGKQKVALSGKIDRIDVDKKQRAIIIDYKTGKGQTANVKEMLEGTSLQLPVYLTAVKQLFKKLNPVAGIYYQVRDSEHCKRIPAVTNVDEVPDILKRGHGRLPNKTYPLQLPELMEAANQHIFRIIKDMEAGNFTFTRFPDNANCRSYCPYRRMCRKDVNKLKAIAQSQDT